MCEAVVQTLLDHQQRTAALAVAARARALRIPLPSSTLHALVDAALSAQNPSLAHSLVSDLRGRQQPLTGPQYRVLLRELGASGKLRELAAVAEEMLEAGHVPPAADMQRLARIYGQSRHMDQWAAIMEKWMGLRAQGSGGEGGNHSNPLGRPSSSDLITPCPSEPAPAARTTVPCDLSPNPKPSPHLTASARQPHGAPHGNPKPNPNTKAGSTRRSKPNSARDHSPNPSPDQSSHAICVLHNKRRTRRNLHQLALGVFRCQENSPCKTQNPQRS